METEPKPTNRDLTRQDLPGILAALSVIVVFCVATALGHLVVGAVVLFGGLVVLLRMTPKEDQEAIGRAIERQEATPIGRVMKAFEVVVGVIVLFAAAHALWSSL